MVSTDLCRRRPKRLERDYEFSRLHEEWTAAVYALVVRTARHGQGFQARSAAACADHGFSHAAYHRPAERKAG